MGKKETGRVSRHRGKGHPKVAGNPVTDQALWRLAEILFEISSNADVNGKDAPKQSHYEEVDDD